MRAPNPRDTDDLVTAILDELKPSRHDREIIAAEIRDWIGVLRSAGDPAIGYWADNQKHAEALRKWIAEGEALFADMPQSFRLLMFFGEWTELFDRTDQKVIGRSRRLLSLLARLRHRCSLILQIKAGPSRKGNRDDTLGKHRAAMAARYLTERCWIPLAHTTGDSPYRVTASLFYEAMTGEPGAGLERACAAVARLPNWEESRRRFRELQSSGRGQIPIERWSGPPEDRYIDGSS
jgi:hypothetical protein